jgi:hypothetical protein
MAPGFEPLDSRIALAADIAFTPYTPTGDFNGDGVEDFLMIDDVGNLSIGSPLNQPNPVVTPFGRIAVLGVEQARIKQVIAGRTGVIGVGDFNDDGRDDLVIKAWNGQMLIAESTGSGFEVNGFGAINDGVTWSDPLLGDFNGDGDLDVAVRETRNGIWWLFAGDDGALDEVRRFGRWNPEATWTFVGSGDFNGDGTTDLAGFTANSAQWWVSPGVEVGVFRSELWAQWNPQTYWVHTSFPNFNRFRIEDFDGDGRDDVLGLASRDFVTPASTGPVTNAPPSGTTPPPADRDLLAWIGRSTGSSFTAQRAPAFDENTVFWLA